MFKKHQEITETIMYQSRLLDPHTNHVKAQERALVFTVQVRHLHDTNSVPKAIYEKTHRALYGTLSSPQKFTFSMFLAADVEGSRKGYIPDHVLHDPLLPHYHGIILFSDEDWERINQNLSEWKAKIKSEIQKIREVKDDEIDLDGCVVKEAVWIEPFDGDRCKLTKHASPIGNYVQYASKTHFQANGRGIETYQPRVYPFDAYATGRDVDSANILFNKLSEDQANLWKEQDRSRQQQFINRKKPKRETIAWQ